MVLFLDGYVCLSSDDQLRWHRYCVYLCVEDDDRGVGPTNATDIDILWIVYILLSGTDDKGLAQRKRGDKITIKQRGTNSLTSHSQCQQSGSSMKAVYIVELPLVGV